MIEALTPAVVAAAGLGGLLGLAADRLAARWPAHEPAVARRGLDWRTLVVIAFGALLCGGLVVRWPDPTDLALLGVFGAALVVLLATDLTPVSETATNQAIDLAGWHLTDSASNLTKFQIPSAGALTVLDPGETLGAWYRIEVT